MSGELQPHAWDSEAERAKLHAAFDRWALAFELGARVQAGQLQRRLTELYRASVIRQQTRGGRREAEES